MIESVVFDMDGVLFDTEQISARAWRRAAEEMGISSIEQVLHDCVGRNAKDTRAYFLAHFGEHFPYDQFREHNRRVFDEILRQEGLPVKLGVYELLGFLKQRGYRIALATSTARKIAVSHLEQTGIDGFFQEIVTGDMITRGKPDPEIYLLACARLDCAPENCMAIEDSPNGIRSACGAGMKTVMVPDLIQPTPELEAMLFQKFGSLLEVMTFLEKLQGGK